MGEDMITEQDEEGRFLLTSATTLYIPCQPPKEGDICMVPDEGGYYQARAILEQYDALKKAFEGIPGEDVVAQMEWLVAEGTRIKRRAEELQAQLRETEAEIEGMKRILVKERRDGGREYSDTGTDVS